MCIFIALCMLFQVNIQVSLTQLSGHVSSPFFNVLHRYYVSCKFIVVLYVK